MLVDADTRAELVGVRLLARADCAHCEGVGERHSEDWTAFEEWRSRRPTLTPEDEDDLVERYFLEVCDYSAVPPMREPCPRCEGTGGASVEIPVRDLLRFVFEHVDRPLVPAPALDEIVENVKKAMTAAALASQGLADGLEAGTWLRTVQEGAEALRSVGELRAKRNGL